MADTATTASEKIMDRVAKLLAIAEHPNTPEAEAEVALMQANSLITKHAIDEALIRQAQTISERREVTHRVIVLGGGEFRPYLRTIFESAASALRVSVASKWSSSAHEQEFHMYGASEDVSWLDMLFNMIKLQFLTKLDPKWDEAVGYDANVYNFKVAGFKWVEIDQTAMTHGHATRQSHSQISTIRDEEDRQWWERRMQFQNGRFIDGNSVREYNGFYHKLKAAYVRHAKMIGDDTRVVTQSHQAYRLSFAESFRSTMSQRFWKMEEDANRDYDSIPGAALAIRDMKDDADRAMWADFPNLSPEEIARMQEEARKQAEAEARAREEMLAAMSPKERAKFLEEEEAKARREAKAQRSWEKKNTRYYSWDETARQRGSSAANSVDLTRKAGSAGQSATKGQIG